MRGRVSRRESTDAAGTGNTGGLLRRGGAWWARLYAHLGQSMAESDVDELLAAPLFVVTGGGYTEDALVTLSGGPVFVTPPKPNDGRGGGSVGAEQAAAAEFASALARLGSASRVLRPLTYDSYTEDGLDGEDVDLGETRFHAERFLEAMGVVPASPPLAVAWLVVQVSAPRHKHGHQRWTYATPLRLYGPMRAEPDGRIILRPSALMRELILLGLCPDNSA